MPTQLQLRRGTTSQNNSFTGAAGELSVDTDLDQIRIHDGSTAGGIKVPATVENCAIARREVSKGPSPLRREFITDKPAAK